MKKKLSPEEKRRIKRINQRYTKTSIETKMTKNDSDTDICLRQSFKARNEQSLSQSFETKAEAEERTKKASPKIKYKSHTKATENIEGDLDQLLEDAKLWVEGQEINWSKKAEQYKSKKSRFYRRSEKCRSDIEIVFAS